MKTHVSRAILTIFLSIGLVQAAAAGVLETGKCSPAAEVRAALAAERQNPIVVGNRTGYGYATAFIFMANADGSRGYLVRGDKPLGEQAEMICVDSVYSGLRLHDISRPGVPGWAKLGGNSQAALAVCTRDKLGYQEHCRFHDDSLANMDQNGLRLLLMAKGTAINPRDKSVRNNQVITVTVDPRDQGGLVKAVTPEGASYSLAAYTKVAHTQHAESLLKAEGGS